MSDAARHNFDPKLDLMLERITDLPPELVWQAWTVREHMVKWFTPKPWTTVDAEVDLRPGGIFRTVMRSPEGEEFPGAGCVLEVVENRKLVWTDALKPGFRPQSASDDAEARAPFHFTATILIERVPTGTKYTAIATHADEEGRAKHAAMGFEPGWGAAFDQLVEYMRGVAVAAG